MEVQNHSISFASILKVVAVLLGIYFLYFIRDLVFILFLALILAALIKPVSDWFKKHKMPAGLGVALIYLILIGGLVSMFIILLPSLIDETKDLVSKLGDYWKSAGAGFDKLQAQSELFVQFGDKLKSLAATGNPSTILTQVFQTARGLVGGLVSGVLVLVIAFYLVNEEDGIKKMARGVIPPQHYGMSVDLAVKIQQKVGAWLKGQLTLMLIVGMMSYVGLLLLHVPNALVLGFIAGLTEMVPYIGPILGAIPAVLIAFGISPLKVLLVIILHSIIQQIENHLLVPKVMQKTIGINPVISILAIATGFKLAGVIGAMVSLPVVAATEVVLREHVFKKMSVPAAMVSSEAAKETVEDSFGPTV